MLTVPYFRQNRDYTCGPVCLRMVLAYWGYETDEVSLSMLCGTDLFGTSAKQIVGAAQRLGFQCEYKFKRPYSALALALRNGVPPIVSVDAAILSIPTVATDLHQTQPCLARNNPKQNYLSRSRSGCKFIRASGHF